MLNKELLQIRANYHSFIFIDSQGKGIQLMILTFFYGERCDFWKTKLAYINRQRTGLDFQNLGLRFQNSLFLEKTICLGRTIGNFIKKFLNLMKR